MGISHRSLLRVSSSNSSSSSNSARAAMLIWLLLLLVTLVGPMSSSASPSLLPSLAEKASRIIQHQQHHQQQQRSNGIVNSRRQVRPSDLARVVNEHANHPGSSASCQAAWQSLRALEQGYFSACTPSSNGRRAHVAEAATVAAPIIHMLATICGPPHQDGHTPAQSIHGTRQYPENSDPPSLAPSLPIQASELPFRSDISLQSDQHHRRGKIIATEEAVASLRDRRDATAQATELTCTLSQLHAAYLQQQNTTRAMANATNDAVHHQAVIVHPIVSANSTFAQTFCDAAPGDGLTGLSRLKVVLDVSEVVLDVNETAFIQQVLSGAVAETNAHLTSLAVSIQTREWENVVHELLTLNHWPLITTLLMDGLASAGNGRIFPQSFATFPNLTRALISLGLYQDNFAQLSIEPSAFAGLHKLTHLLLQSNRLSLLPSGAFDDLSNLAQLDLSKNDLTSFPPGLLRQLSSLQTLTMSNNRISALHPRAFEALTHLTALHAHDNEIASIPATLFRAATALVHLSLSNNALTSIRPGTFEQLPSLRALLLNANSITLLPKQLAPDSPNLQQISLQLNRITQLSSDVFAGSRVISRLQLHTNAIRALPPRLFAGLTLLASLMLESNAITSIADSAFSGLPALFRLSLHSNQISTLSSSAFADLTSLQSLYLQDNAITSLPPGIFLSQTRLENLWLYDNAISSLHPNLFVGLSRLKSLYLNNNQLSKITEPHFRDLTRLRELRLNDNSLSTLTRAFTSSTALSELYLAHNKRLALSLHDLAPLAHSIKLLDATGISSLELRSQPVPAFPNLEALLLAQTPINGLRPATFTGLVRNQLVRLSLGWSALSDAVLPVSAICDVLSEADVTLTLTRTSYTEFLGCSGKLIDSLSLVDNPSLTRVFTHAHSVLDLSNNPLLAELDTVGDVGILDISHTDIPFSPRHCTSLGSEAFFGSDLTHPSYAANAELLLQNCFEKGLVFDFSQNTWLADISLIERATPKRVVLGENELDTPDYFADTLFTAEFRETIPLILLEGTAIECGVQIGLADLGRSRVTRPTFTFNCRCASNHRRAGNLCVSTALSSSDIAGIAFGAMVLVCLVSAPFLFAWYRRKQRERYALMQEKELQEHLLGEELESLKKGWQIDLGELDLIVKVDEGAFGEVWKAEWDGVDVAVKFLKLSVLGMADSFMLEDLDKEVDFLRRTRHSHLVRFFGTGIDRSGAPFLVLEFVDLGSLKHLITTVGLQNALRTYLVQQRNESNTSTRSLDATSSTGMGVAQDARRSLPLTDLQSLKMRLTEDIAQGMAFLHSLNVIHRDLKSGNVLVTKRLSAKITDFGSMSGRLTKLESSHDDEATSSSALNNANDVDASQATAAYVFDPVYSATASSDTIGVTMTAGVGTPLYMAPEVLSPQPQKLTLKIDVFSFGVLMWEIFTERVPDLLLQELGKDFQGFVMQTLYRLYSQGLRLQFPPRASDSPSDADEDLSSTSGSANRSKTAAGDSYHQLSPWFEELSASCMSFTPSARPTFMAILQVIHAHSSPTTSNTSTSDDAADAVALQQTLA